MHTSKTLSLNGFDITAQGTSATLDDVLPDLTVHDRLAIVTNSPGGSLAAAPLLLAADYIARAARASHGVLTEAQIGAIIDRSGQPQGFNRVTATEALARICAYGPAPGVLGQDAEYLRRHGADDATMQPHRYPVG